jgi:succinate dehydrogenase / fumarate reductase cytochrome b subunit
MRETTNPLPGTIHSRPGTMRLVDAFQYRLPVAGIVSILHRVSGAVMFVLLPFVIWLFDVSVSSEASYDRFSAAFLSGIGAVPAWFVKLVVLALVWSYLHHAIAGIRHLWMDMTHSVELGQGRSSAIATLAISLVLTIALGAKLFGIY